jgi:hypothetical protein
MQNTPIEEEERDALLSGDFWQDASRGLGDF